MCGVSLNSLDLEISNPCNEKCLHCYRTCEHTKHGFLSCADVEFILKETSSFMAKDAKILLTGGEVLLNKEWKDIVQLVAKSGKRFSIFTNGSLMTESDVDFIKSFVGKGLKEVQLSLYAIDDDIHDAITGIKGSCKKTKAAIEMLKERGVPIFISCPAMQANKNDFFKVMSWCDKNKIPSCACLIIFDPSDYSGSNKQQLTENDLKIFFEISMQHNGELSYIWGKRKERNLSEINFYDGAVSNLCIAGNGDVYPMVGWYEKLGNIHTDKLKDIFYNNELLNHTRKYKVSDFPECVKCEANDFCVFCPTSHLTANHGELGKLDTVFCDYARMIKKFATKRDEILNTKNKRGSNKMLYRLKQNVYIKKNGDNTIIGDPYSNRESIVNASGGVFLDALSHIPQTLESLVDKILKVFVGVSKEAITPDAKDFYNNFVKEGYLVCGESYADCNAAEYGWGYDIQAAKDAQNTKPEQKAYFHLPGLFELYDFYKKFLFIFYNYREFFYDWAAIHSLYGCPEYCVWNSGRIHTKEARANVRLALNLVKEYGLSAKFTFSNSLLEEKHLHDTYCNYLLELFHDESNGIILQSDLLLDYISKNYPKYYFVSSTTKCITDKEKLFEELKNDKFKYVVPDYNFVNDFEVLDQIPTKERQKVELMSNTVCVPNCPARSKHYEYMSNVSLYQKKESFSCASNSEGKRFSLSKKSKKFITIEKIQHEYLPRGFVNFKLEGRNYGELRLLEEILYYMVKLEHQLEVREMMYLTSGTDFPKE